MKHVLTAAILLCTLAATAQNNQWFVSVSSDFVIAGPGAALKQKMLRQGFDDDNTSYFLFIGWTEINPKKLSYGGLKVRGGKKLSDKRSVYFTAALVEDAEVRGFKSSGYSSTILGAGSTGSAVSIRYSLWQLAAGYMYSSKSKMKLGLGPSFFLLNYKPNEEKKQNVLAPGASFTARVPLGKEKKLFGIELVAEANLAPPAKMKMEKQNDQGFEPGSVNMVFGSIGFAFCFRR
jgi:hypothetical protein